LFFNVTVAEVILLTLPWETVKACTYLNELPNGGDSAPRYQLVNAVFTAASAVRLVVWRLLPLNWKVACVTSLDVAYPVTCSSKPDVVRFTIATLVITGTPRAIWTEALGAGDGVTSTLPARKLTVTVILPAVVPVENWLAVEVAKLACVPSAATVKFTVLPPGNATVWSSIGLTASAVNPSVTVPVSAAP